MNRAKEFCQKNWYVFLTALVLFSGVGCSSMIPKSVELGQRQVEALPVMTPKETERLRQAAALAVEKAAVASIEAAKVDAPPEVSAPLLEALELSSAVATSLGPPLKPALSPEVAAAVLRDLARLNNRIDKFAIRNDRWAGYDIEGSGRLQVPYFVWAGGSVLLFVAIFVAARMGLSLLANANPVVAGVFGGARVAGSLAAKMASNVIKGGDKFKAAVRDANRALSPEEIIELFRAEQEKAQDHDVKVVIDTVTKK